MATTIGSSVFVQVAGCKFVIARGPAYFDHPESVSRLCTSILLRIRHRGRFPSPFFLCLSNRIVSTAVRLQWRMQQRYFMENHQWRSKIWCAQNAQPPYEVFRNASSKSFPKDLNEWWTVYLIFLRVKGKSLLCRNNGHCPLISWPPPPPPPPLLNEEISTMFR